MNLSHEGREGNWVFHLLDAGAMLPYFHSSGPRHLQLNFEGNMFTEITYMRLWHGQTRAIGVATDYHHMAKWALRFHLNGEGIAECSIFEQH